MCNCSDCDYESCDEKYNGEWMYFCSLDDDEREIELDENEEHPYWCPLTTQQGTK